MKLDKEFMVLADGEIFQSKDIESIIMAGGYCNITVFPDGEEKRKVKCKLKDVGFADSVTTLQSPKRTVYETVLWNCLGDRKSDVEIVTPLGEIREALIDALKTVGENQQCDVTLKIDGKDFASMVKKYNHTGGD